MNDKIDLTILSVNYKSKQYLDYNFSLTKNNNKKNNIHKWEWIIVNNSLDEFENFAKLNNNFRIITGVEMPDLDKEIRGSYHHAEALNKGLKYVDSRFLLVLDPDFYIIRNNWIAEVLNYMVKKELAFFGAPWHPKYITKYRYFPCVHCMFIDLHKVSKNDLNFMPELIKTTSSNASADKLDFFNYLWHIYSQLHKPFYGIFKPIFGNIFNNLYARSAIGCSNDTGVKLYRKFFHDKKIKREMLKPVYKSEKRNLPKQYSDHYKLTKFFDKILPDKLSYLPKKEHYFTKNGFKEHNYFDANAAGYDEFMWQEKIFGLHLRNYLAKKNAGYNNHVQNIKQIVNNI